MPTYSSPGWPITKAMVAALLAAPGVVTFVGPDGVFADRVPADVPVPYISLGSASELPRPHFHRSGAENTDELHIWAATRQEVQQIFGAVAPVLQGARLTLDGHTAIVASIEMVATIRDPSGVAHGVARYTTRTLAGAQ